MLIAKQKRKENIAEYLLYMWQVEDLLRAECLDMDRVVRDIVSRYNVSPEQLTEIRDWYENLVLMMQKENLQNGGHLQINKNLIITLTDLHLQLLESPKFADYSAAFYQTLPYIVQLRNKAGDNKVGEVETCFNALYGMLLLRLQRKDISEDTTKALAQISKFVSLLASYFKKDEEHPLFAEEDK